MSRAVCAAGFSFIENDIVERTEAIMRPHSLQKSLNRFGAGPHRPASLVIEKGSPRLRAVSASVRIAARGNGLNCCVSTIMSWGFSHNKGC